MSTTGRTQHGQPKPRPALTSEAYSPRTRSTKPIARSAPPKPSKEDGTGTFRVDNTVNDMDMAPWTSNTPNGGREGKKKVQAGSVAVASIVCDQTATGRHFGRLSLLSLRTDSAPILRSTTSRLFLCLTVALRLDGCAAIRGEFKLGTTRFGMRSRFAISPPAHSSLTSRSLSGSDLSATSHSLSTVSLRRALGSPTVTCASPLCAKSDLASVLSLR